MTVYRIVSSLAFLCVLLTGCGHRPDGDPSALASMWQRGDEAGAIQEARAWVARVAQANGVTLEAVHSGARAIREELSSVPVPPTDAASSSEKRAFSLESGTLDEELRAALLSADAVVMMRAAVTVGELSLKRHAIGLLAVITHPGPVELKGVFHHLPSPGLAWLIAKQVALESLAQLAAD